MTVGQGKIQQHRVNPAGRQPVDALRQPLGALQDEAVHCGFPEDRLDQVRVAWIVLNEEDADERNW